MALNYAGEFQRMAASVWENSTITSAPVHLWHFSCVAVKCQGPGFPAPLLFSFLIILTFSSDVDCVYAGCTRREWIGMSITARWMSCVTFACGTPCTWWPLKLILYFSIFFHWTVFLFFYFFIVLEIVGLIPSSSLLLWTIHFTRASCGIFISCVRFRTSQNLLFRKKVCLKMSHSTAEMCLVFKLNPPAVGLRLITNTRSQESPKEHSF